MEVYMLDKGFQTLALIDDFESLIWRRKYFACGEFSFYISANMFESLKSASYICKSDSDEIGIIESFKLTDTNLIIKGRFGRSLLSRYVIYPTVTVKNKSVGATLSEQVSERMTGISIGNVVEGENITTQQTGGTLMDWADSLTIEQGLTHDIVYDYAENKLAFTVKQGRDLRQEQNVNNPVVFSPEWDNLIGFEYDHSERDYKNYAIVSGEDSGTDRKNVVVDMVADGDERRELWVDAKSLRSDGFTQEEYLSNLEQYGREKLSAYGRIDCFSADVTADSYVYREDYDLGDIVNVSVPKYGIYADFRITEIEEVYEKGERSLSLTFGQGYLLVNEYIIRELK